MKVYNTRFNPTVNGPLHIGHLYVIKVNEAMAHDFGHHGKFTMRFDDNQKFYQMMRPADEMDRLKIEMRSDVEWAGVKVDAWTSQLSLEQTTKSFLQRFNNGPLKVIEPFQHRNLPDIISATIVPFPYAPVFTAEKVILDTLDYITWLIRGEDLIDEYSLYTYFCDIWDLHNPEHVYLPRLLLDHKTELIEDITVVSKTAGKNTIREYRLQGWTPKQLIDKLADSCLKKPEMGWNIENIKEQPVWNE